MSGIDIPGKPYLITPLIGLTIGSKQKGQRLWFQSSWFEIVL